MARRLELNLTRVRERIARAAGSRAGAVQLLAVTKSVSPETTRELALAGQTDLAENRAEVLESKAAALADLDVSWHFVGHIQRNKARRIVPHCTTIHSVDSPRLVGTLQRLAEEFDRELEVYLQVNATGEAQKYGMAPERIGEAVAALAESPRLRWLGLMTMGPTGAEPDATRGAFDRTAELGRELERSAHRELLTLGECRLSMGMSQDLETAIAAGSHVVRVGRALFEGLPDGNRG